MKKTFVLLFLTTLFIACHQGTNDHNEADHNHPHSQQHKERKGHQHHHHDDNKSNHLMNKQDFNDLVNAFEDPKRADYQKPAAVLDKLGDIKGKRIMDIGAGTGYFSFRMVDRGATVIAADVDDRFLEYIKKKQGEKGIEESKLITKKVPYDSPNLEAEEIDAAIIVNTYHHIENRGDYFEQVLKGLKTKGKLLIVDFKKKETPHGPPKNHRIAVDEVARELGQLKNVEVEQDVSTLEEQYIVILTKH